MSTFYGLSPYFFYRSTVKTRPMRGEMDGNVSTFRHSWLFLLLNSTIKELLPQQSTRKRLESLNYFNQALKISTGERRPLWHKYVSILVLNFNTPNNASVGCEPSRVFHGSIHYNAVYLKLGTRVEQAPIPAWQNAQDAPNKQK